MISRIDTIWYWYDEFNETEFNNKLTRPRFGITRSRYVDGYFEFVSTKDDDIPLRHMEKSRIVIATRCFGDEDLLKGTLLHEMLHQYQIEVLNRRGNHDAVFTSMARRLERKYGFSVR